MPYYIEFNRFIFKWSYMIKGKKLQSCLKRLPNFRIYADVLTFREFTMIFNWRKATSVVESGTLYRFMSNWGYSRKIILTFMFELSISNCCMRKFDSESWFLFYSWSSYPNTIFFIHYSGSFSSQSEGYS